MKKLIVLSLIGIFAMCSTGMAEEEGVICQEVPAKEECCADYYLYTLDQCIEAMQPDIYNQCNDNWYWDFENCMYWGLYSVIFTCQDIATDAYNYCMVF